LHRTDPEGRVGGESELEGQPIEAAVTASAATG
jgi:hypothetical protein